MFYLTSKFHDNRVNTFGFMEGGGGGGLLKPSPQAQELQKSPGGIGLTVSLLYVVALYFFCSLALNLHKRY